MNSSGARRKNDRAAEIVSREAALFIAQEASTESLITVVRTESVAHGERILVFVSVFPIEKARAAIAFLEHHRHEFSDYLKSRVHMRLPRVDFLLDNGESVGEIPKS